MWEYVLCRRNVSRTSLYYPLCVHQYGKLSKIIHYLFILFCYHLFHFYSKTDLKEKNKIKIWETIFNLIKESPIFLSHECSSKICTSTTGSLFSSRLHRFISCQHKCRSASQGDHFQECFPKIPSAWLGCLYCLMWQL